MEITIKGETKEITALIIELQERLEKFVPTSGKEKNCINLD